MSNTLPPLALSSGGWEPPPNRKRFTRKECEFLEQNGLLKGRYELIDGEIIYKMPQNPPHIFTLAIIAEWLRSLFGGLYVITQSSIDVDVVDPEINEPEPDIFVLAQPITAFAARNIVSSDLILLVEVSETTLRYDLRNKAALYARAGIIEYWVADISGRRFIVHRNPGADGYAQVTEYTADETVSPLARPDTAVRVADLLPPAQL
jgi:Uma2 family endonuclease